MYELTQAIELLKENKQDDFIEKLNIFFNVLSNEEKIEESILISLLELDRHLENVPDSRRKLATKINLEFIKNLQVPYHEFITEILSPRKFHDIHRVTLLEKLNTEFTNDIGVTCSYAVAFANEAVEKNDLQALKTCLKLFDSCGSVIDRNNAISICRVNVVLFLVEVLSTSTNYDEIDSLLSDTIQKKWCLNSGLTNELITIKHMYNSAKNLHKKMLTDFEEDRNKMISEISDQKMKLIEIMGVFVTLIAILGLTLYSLSDNSVNNWNKKGVFLLKSTSCMIFFISSITIMLSHKVKKILYLFLILSLLLFFLMSNYHFLNYIYNY